ncbi:MAG: hypothetical protein ACYTF3_09965, partial [Planctomycetota bacterium]
MSAAGRWSLWAVALLCLGRVSPAVAQSACNPSYPELCDLVVNSTIEQPDYARAVDVVFLGDGFTDMAAWRGIAQNHINAIKNQNRSLLYPAVPEVWNFHVVEVISQTTNVTNDDRSDTALGMRSVGSEAISGNGFLAGLAAANAPDVDVVYMVANTNGGRANASFPGSLASGGSIRMPRGTGPATHELGHAVVRLHDEYQENSRCSVGAEALYASTRNVTADPTCQRFDTPGAGCVEGNVYCNRGLYRPRNGCLMRSSGNVEPCPVCAETITNVLLERRTGQDVSDPWPVISTPASGSTLTGVVSVRVTWWDDHRTEGELLLELDDAVVAQAEVESGSVLLSFDTRRFADGDYLLTPVGIDRAGHGRRGISFPVQIANGGAAGPVVFNVFGPADGAEVSGTVFVGARATDEAGQQRQDVEQMSVRIDGELVAAIAGGQLFGSWDASAAAPGPHVIAFEARTLDQVIHTSDPIGVTVVEGALRAGSVFVQRPEPWTAIGGGFLLDFSPFGISPDATLALLLDGAPVEPNPLAGVSVPDAGGQGEGGRVQVFVDSEAWALGPHQIVVRAEQPAGVVDSQAVPVVRTEPEGPSVWFWGVPFTATATEQVQVGAAGPAGIRRIALRVNGDEVGAVEVERGVIPWDTTALPDGCQVDVRAVVEDVEGRTAESAPVTVCVANAPPELEITQPLDGARVPAGAVAVAVTARAPNGIAPGWTIELLLDDEVVRAQPEVFGTFNTWLDLDAGVYRLQARAIGRSGVVTPSEVVEIRVEQCADDEACDDADVCTDDLCAPSGACLNVRRLDCCDGDGDCDDGDPCTDDACEDGLCTRTEAEDCCGWDAECADGNRCSANRCVPAGPGGVCEVEDDGRCCVEDVDCTDEDSCTTGRCVEGFCAFDRAPDCCEGDADCDDGNPCTTGACVDGMCAREDIPGCCVTRGDCATDDPCASPVCSNNVCSSQPIRGCCQADADCASLDPCVATSCNLENNRCTEVRDEGCCVFDSDCVDRDVCTEDRCVDGLCEYRFICCENDDGCDDGLLCTADACVDGLCQAPPIPGCCLEDGDCDDGDACTANTCEANACVAAEIADCCRDNGDCEDGDACTANTCEDNACVAA